MASDHVVKKAGSLSQSVSNASGFLVTSQIFWKRGRGVGAEMALVQAEEGRGALCKWLVPRIHEKQPQVSEKAKTPFLIQVGSLY